MLNDWSGQPTHNTERDMKIKNDKSLRHLADVAGVTPETMSKRLVRNLLKFDERIEDDCNWGLYVSDLIDYETLTSDIAKLLDRCGIKRRTIADVRAFFDCVVMGDGECDECGGNVEVEEIGHYVHNSRDYDSPPDFIVDEYVYICQHCGERKVYEV